MVDAASSALKFVSGRTREHLESDEMLRFALVRAIEVVGEAASRIDADTRSSIPTIPWPAVVSMRNRLIHAYFNIDLDILWRTATIEMPELLASLAPYAKR